MKKIIYIFAIFILISSGCSNKDTNIVSSNGNTNLSPSAPLNFSVAIGNKKLILTWQTPSDSGASAITSYKIYRGQSAGSEAFFISIQVCTSFIDTNVVNGNKYYYYISAVNNNGESIKSNESYNIPSSTNNVPTPPLIFKVTSNLYCPLLTWQVPIDSGSSKIIKYNIYRGISGNILLIGNTSNYLLKFADTTGMENTNYIYYVTALNNYGESLHSNQDTNYYKSITGNWIFTIDQDGGYTNPPPTIFYISSTGYFSKSVKLWVGLWSGSDHYEFRTISGKVAANGKITDGLILGGNSDGQFTCNQFDYFNTNNYSVDGAFYHYVTLGSNYYYKETGTWNATKEQK
jgi:hypothetical protein